MVDLVLFKEEHELIRDLRELELAKQIRYLIRSPLSCSFIPELKLFWIAEMRPDVFMKIVPNSHCSTFSFLAVDAMYILGSILTGSERFSTSTRNLIVSRQLLWVSFAT